MNESHLSMIFLLCVLRFLRLRWGLWCFRVCCHVTYDTKKLMLLRFRSLQCIFNIKDSFLDFPVCIVGRHHSHINLLLHFLFATAFIEHLKDIFVMFFRIFQILKLFALHLQSLSEIQSRTSNCLHFPDRHLHFLHCLGQIFNIFALTQQFLSFQLLKTCSYQVGIWPGEN